MKMSNGKLDRFIKDTGIWYSVLHYLFITFILLVLIVEFRMEIRDFAVVTLILLIYRLNTAKRAREKP